MAKRLVGEGRDFGETNLHSAHAEFLMAARVAIVVCRNSFAAPEADR